MPGRDPGAQRRRHLERADTRAMAAHHELRAHCLELTARTISWAAAAVEYESRVQRSHGEPLLFDRGGDPFSRVATATQVLQRTIDILQHVGVLSTFGSVPTDPAKKRD